MATRDELLTAVETRLRQAAAGDLTPVLAPGAADEAGRLAVLLTEGDGDLHARYLLGMLYWHRSQGLPGGQDLSAAVTLLKPCFAVGIGSFPPALGTALAERAIPEALVAIQRAMSSADQDAVQGAADIWGRIRDAIPPGHPRYAACQVAAGIALQTLFGRTGNPADLDAAIRAHEAALDAASGQAESAIALAAALRQRFLLRGSRQDLDVAITLTETAVRAARPGTPALASAETNLGLMLLDRFGQTGSLTDLSAAIGACQDAVRDSVAGDPELASRYSNLGLALRARFKTTGDPADLDAAIDMTRTCLDATPAGHPSLPAIRSNLGLQLFERSLQTGDLGDLDAAVDASRAAVEATPAAQPDRISMLTNLGNALQARFERSGSLADLDAAVNASRSAAEAAPAGHPSRPAMLANLGVGLRLRFDRLGAAEDLDEAISVGQRAVDAVPLGHTDRANFLSMLGNAYVARFRQAGGLPADLDAAVKAGAEAVAAFPEGHPDRASVLSNLASALGARFEHGSVPSDLDAAVNACRAAADAAPDGHPSRVGYLTNLATALRGRFQRGGEPADHDGALAAFQEAAAIVSGRPSTRIVAAYAGAAFIAATDPGQASDLMETAVLLLPLLTPRYLERGDQQHVLGGYAGVASDAAALALADTRDGMSGPLPAARALRLLEAGRALLLSQAYETRSDLTDLRRDHPALAERFAGLRDRLNRPPDHAPGRPGEQHGQGRQPEDSRLLARQLDETLAEIRGLDGFATFALPPGISELQAQADEGPVVTFNISQYRSDALLLTRDAVTSVALPGLTSEAVTERVIAFHRAAGIAADDSSLAARLDAEQVIADILEWLWDNAAEPVLHALGYDEPAADDVAPRVWWAPGGLLSLLPLHAAGRPDGAAGDCVLDRVVSSYTPTVRALRYARQQAAGPDGPGGALIVGVAAVPGSPEADLPDVPEEIARVSDLLPDPIVLTDGADPETHPTRVNVFAWLPSCSVVHFACHAVSAPGDPLGPMLFLPDHEGAPLNVASLSSISHDRLRLVYLSACSTAQISDARLLDEAIHLTSAFQLAGSRHVIGTLWKIDSHAAVDVAAGFYRELRTEAGALNASRAARALHRVVMVARAAHPRAPSLWAAHLHAGA